MRRRVAARGLAVSWARIRIPMSHAAGGTSLSLPFLGKAGVRALSRRALPVMLSLLALLPGSARAGAGPAVLQATLQNGLRVVIVPNSLAPVVTTVINYLVGANESPSGFPGMAHAQEHMMFRGSPDLSADQLSNIIAALGGASNAETQQTVTQYFLTVPADQLDVAFHIEATRMRDILDSQDLWAAERGAIVQEVAQDLSQPEYVFHSRLLSQMYAGTPYAHDALGTRSSFEKTTAAMLKRFYDRWYAPNNAILVIAGNVDPVHTLAHVRRLFESIPPRPVPARPPVHLQALTPALIRLDTDLPYGLAAVAYRLPGYESPDFAAGQVLADVLGSRRGKLYAMVPEGKALSADFAYEALPNSALGYALASFPPGRQAAALVARMKAVLADCAKNGVPAELVEAAKRHEAAEAEFQKNSVEGLAAAWSQALAVEGRHSPDDDIEAIRKVTVEDVNRVARTSLVNDTATAAILTPRPSAIPVASKTISRQESFAPERTQAVTLPAWAERATQLPRLLTSGVNPRLTLLPNGLRLIVQPETVSRAVRVYGRVKNTPDLQVPPGKEGVDRVLDDLFTYGTRRLDRLALQRALDDLGAEMSAGAEFSLSVLADQFDRGVELLAENLLQPALPMAAFRIVRQQTMEALTGELHSPAYLSRRALRRALFPVKDPTLRQATPETVGSLDLEDVTAYYHQVFRPDMTTIVVTGDVTPEQARASIEKYFGAWTVTGAQPDTELPPVPQNQPSATVVPDASRVQDKVTIAETLGLTRSHPDYYALQVGRHVLAGGFYATQLYRDLREVTGLVYSVEAVLDIGKTRGIFAVQYASDPSNVSKARALVERDLRRMCAAPVSEEELQRAKTLLLRKILLSESSLDGIGHGLLERAVKDLPLDEPVRAAQHYREITAAQVQAAFTKWIRPGDFVQVTLGPNPE